MRLQADDRDHQVWYRHHDLVRDELLTRARRDLDEASMLAARLIVIEAMLMVRPVLATQIAIEAGDWQVLEDVLRVTFARVLHAGLNGEQASLARIPSAALTERPALRAISLIHQSLQPRDPIARVMAGLKLATGRAIDMPADAAAIDRVIVSTIRMVTSRFLGDSDAAIRHASDAVTAMVDLSDADIAKYSETLSTINTQKAATYLYANMFDQAELALERVFNADVAAGAAVPEVAHARALAALSSALKGDIPATLGAIESCERLDLPHDWRDSLFSSNYRIAKALVRLEQGDPAAASQECHRVDCYERRLESWPILAFARCLATEAIAGPTEALIELERTLVSHRFGFPMLVPFQRLIAHASSRIRWQSGLAVNAAAMPVDSFASVYAHAARGDWSRMIDGATAVARITAAHPRRRAEALMLQAVGALHSARRPWAVERFVLANDLLRANGLTTPALALRRADAEALLAIATSNDPEFVPAFELPRGTTARRDDARPLSPAEVRTLEAIRLGGSVDGAAKGLFITTHTVRDHLKSIYRKLGVHSRPDAIRRAIELGYLRPSVRERSARDGS